MATEITSARVFLGTNDSDVPGSPQVGDVVIIPGSSYHWLYTGSWQKNNNSDLIVLAAVLAKFAAPINVTVL